MKRRNTFVALVLIVAVLVLGVGYAAITAVNFTVHGSATASSDQNNFHVYFDSLNEDEIDEYGKVTNVNNSEYVINEFSGEREPEVTIDIISETDATISVKGYSVVNDKVTVKIPIKNDSIGMAAALSEPQVSSSGVNASYFDITANYDNGQILQDGDSTYLNIVIKLNKSIITDDKTVLFTIGFDAEATDPIEEEI